jgi:hypothetical protein
VDLYIPSLTRLHGVVLNYLSMGTTLPSFYLYRFLTSFSSPFQRYYFSNPFWLQSNVKHLPIYLLPLTYGMNMAADNFYSCGVLLGYRAGHGYPD